MICRLYFLRFIVFSALSLVFCLGLAQSEAFAQERRRPAATHTDEWSDPNPGIRYLHRVTSTPTEIHALIVDLSAPGVRIRATPHAERWQTVSAYAQTNRLAAAVNGGFWTFMQHADGMTAGGGHRWPDGEDDEELGYFAVTRAGRAWISEPERVQDDVPNERVSEAVSGRPLLVRSGAVDTVALDEFPYANLRHPRTAVGVSRDGKKVILIVSDGRQNFSRGMTLYELGRMFVELGAHMALNLDGGGSSTMYVEEAGGIVNSPSGGRWEARLGLGADEEKVEKQRVSKVRVADGGVEQVYVRGVEREVMNHLGVIAPAPERAGPGEPAIDRQKAPRAPVIVQPPREPAMRLGRMREWLYPVAYALAAALPVALLLFLILRRRSGRSRGSAVKR